MARVVAITLLTGGAGLLAYLAAWVLIPREEPSAADDEGDGAGDAKSHEPATGVRGIPIHSSARFLGVRHTV